MSRIVCPLPQFNLDAYNALSNPLGVQVSGGAAVLDAAGGLPRRVTPAVDYGARVLALGPTAFWRLNEPSGNFLDRVGTNHLTPTTVTRGQPGHGAGGDSGVGISGTGTLATSATPINLVAGTPFSVMAWTKWPNLTAAAAIVHVGTRATAWGNPAGWTFGSENYQLCVNYGSGTAFVMIYTTERTGSIGRLYAGEFLPTFAVYNGGALDAAASWSLYLGGTKLTTAVVGTLAAAGVGTEMRVGSGNGGVNMREQDVAVWSGTALTEAQIKGIVSEIACGTARWTLPAAAYLRTLKGWQLPGRLARADLTRLGVRSYYQIGAGARTEFDPGDDLSVSIPAGSACYLDADLTHHHLDDLPWIADPSGGGPIALYEEADPPAVLVPVAALEPVPVVALATAEPVQAEVIAPEPEAVQLIIAGDGT